VRRVPATTNFVVLPDDLFSEEDISQLTAQARLPLQSGAEPKELASKLTGIATRFVGRTLLWTAADTRDERANFLRKVEKRALGLLAEFGLDTQAALPEAGDPDSLIRAIALLNEVPPADREPEEPIDASEQLKEIVQRIKSLAHRARRAAEQIDRKKGRPRQIPRAEDAFFEELHEMFFCCFGRMFNALTLPREPITSTRRRRDHLNFHQFCDTTHSDTTRPVIGFQGRVFLRSLLQQVNGRQYRARGPTIA